MRGLGRLRRAGRRLGGRLARPAPVAPASALLAEALLPAYAPGGAVEGASLCAAFRPIHDETSLAAIAADPAADRGLGALAAAMQAGRQPVFDHWLDQALLPDWRQVPGGGRWPSLPASAYDHGDFTAHGDVRQLWELGRLQSLPTLLAAALQVAPRQPDTAEDYRQAAFALLADFRARNPVGHGPHWIAGLESGLRIFSLLWAWQLLPATADERPERRLLLAASLLENARFTAAHLSEKALANNHLLGEAAALYCLGCALPVFSESEAWRARGEAILRRELPLQLLDDGLLAEQAVEYHRFVLDFLIQCLLWAEASGGAAAPFWRERAASMVRPLAALTGPEGLLVPLGDDDGGRVLRLDDRPRRDARSLLTLASRLLGARNLGELGAAAPAGEALWLAGPARAAAPGAPGALTARDCFPAAGWYTARFGAPAGAAGLPGGLLVFKAGPMGRGAAGHGHADILSLSLSLDGRPLLVDPGTYLYNGPQRWRDFFRGAAAHSLLRAGGRDPAEALPPPDRFGWARQCAAELADSSAPLPGALLDWTARRRGDRDAAGEPVAVSRRLALLAPDLLLVIDRAEGSSTASLPLELHWQAAGGLGALPIERLAAARATGLEALPGLGLHELLLGENETPRLWMQCFVPAALDSVLQMGHEEAPAGWVSPSYGQREPALHWRLKGAVAEGGVCLSLLAVAAGSYRGCRLQAGPPGQVRLEILRAEADTLTMDLPSPAANPATGNDG